MKWPREIYKGNWMNGKPHGFGTYTWILKNENGVCEDARQLPTEIMDKILNNQYTGDFVNGIREGFGVFFYGSGAVYSGQWKNNQKHGKGKYIFKSGKTFEGDFHDDHMSISENETSKTPNSVCFETPTPRLHPSTPTQNDNVLQRNEQILTDGPGFTLELEILLKNEPNKLATSTAIIHQFIINSIQLHQLYQTYANLGNQVYSSNALLSRFQFWQFLLDFKYSFPKDSLSLPIPIIDQIIANHRAVTSISNPDEQFLYREFISSLLIVANFMKCSEQGQFTNNLLKFFDMLKNFKNEHSDDIFWLQKVSKRDAVYHKIKKLYEHLTIVSLTNHEKNSYIKTVNGKGILVFLKHIDIIKDPEVIPEKKLPEESQELKEELDVENKSSRKNSTIRISRSSTEKPKSISPVPEQSTEKLEIEMLEEEPIKNSELSIGESEPFCDDLTTDMILKIIVDVDLKRSKSEFLTEEGDIHYDIEREFSMLEVVVIFLHVGKYFKIVQNFSRNFQEFFLIAV